MAEQELAVYVYPNDISNSLANKSVWTDWGVTGEKAVSDCLSDVSVLAALFGRVSPDSAHIHILHSFFTFDASTERFQQVVQHISDALPADVVFVGTLSLSSSVESEVDDEVVIGLADEAGLVVQVEAMETDVRQGEWERMTVTVKELDGGWRKAVVRVGQVDALSRDRITLLVTHPITLDFLVHISQSDMKEKLKERSEELKKRVEQLCFYCSRAQTLIFPEGSVSSPFPDSTVSHLYRQSLSDPDMVPKNKIFYSHQDCIVLSAVENVSNDRGGNGDCPLTVPLIHTKNGKYKEYVCEFAIKGVVSVGADSHVTEMAPLLTRALSRQIRAAFRCLMDYSSFSSSEKILLNIPRSCLFLPSNWNSFLTLYYPKSTDQKTLEVMRERVHSLFNLPFGRPAVRPSMTYVFPTQQNTHLLRDVHLHVKPGNVVGSVDRVRGHYDYHHYMQDGIDDNGWGCAYRSFQTVWSWFLLQGYTQSPVPTHRQIQQALVAVGDRPASFVGTRQWIGSMELSYCLDHLLSITSRIVTASTGAELSEKARELAVHFQTEGTPIMIGGGVLAHTILGVDFNEDTGDARYLVLDPHYTGDEDIKTIVNKGWCGWKTESFWDVAAFYNMLLPLCPKNVI